MRGITGFAAQPKIRLIGTKLETHVATETKET
jgi:hypothetical protein